MWFSSPTGRLKDNLRFGHGLLKPSRISSCIQTLGAGLCANPIRNKSCYRSHLCLTSTQFILLFIYLDSVATAPASFIIHAWKVLKVLQLWLFYIELRASSKIKCTNSFEAIFFISFSIHLPCIIRGCVLVLEFRHLKQHSCGESIDDMHLDFATWLQQRALLQLHYRVGKVLVIYDSLWKVEARFLSVSWTILDGISCATLRDSCFVDRLLGVNPSLDVSGYMSNTSTIEKFLTSKPIFKRILEVLVGVHNLSATIRDLRVDYDVVI
ncbi:hypothetical protein NC651_032247 [Populus alba x Populus x berolinensis]|nr:hypothetical protein NC651_032247 [Populus alba x Populus x berolinensis]